MNKLNLLLLKYFLIPSFNKKKLILLKMRILRYKDIYIYL